MRDVKRDLASLNKRLEEAGEQDLKREVARLEEKISNVEYLILNGVEFVSTNFNYS
tara:strand:+ start:413 stop:580 length:168 start_codon:yes stop_codon:yes gene_type:complete